MNALSNSVIKVFEEVETKLLIESTVQAIHANLATERQSFIEVGRLLKTLYNIAWKEAAHRKIGESSFRADFERFIQQEFKIGVRRAGEYMRVAEDDSLSSFKMPISSIIELNRLSAGDLESLLKKYPKEELEVMNFIDLKKAAREFNTKSRNTKTKAAVVGFVLPEAAEHDDIKELLRAELHKVIRGFKNPEIIAFLRELEDWAKTERAKLLKKTVVMSGKKTATAA